MVNWAHWTILYRYHWQLGIASQVALVSRHTCKPPLSTIWGWRIKIMDGRQVVAEVRVTAVAYI